MLCEIAGPQGGGGTGPHQPTWRDLAGTSLPHPLCGPLFSPLNLCTAFAFPGFLPSQGEEQAPLQVALSSTLFKADSLKGSAGAAAGSLLPYLVQPSLAHDHYLVLTGDCLSKYPQSLHYRFLIAVSLPRFFGIPLLRGAQSQSILALSSVK